MMKIVIDAGYKGYVGIEYEGRELSEGDPKSLSSLERVRYDFPIRLNMKGKSFQYSESERSDGNAK
jgi:hypothetical protein